MVAGTLSQAGYYMGEQLLPADESNPKGYFEDREINAINEDLLAPVIPKRRVILGKERFRHRPLRNQRWLASIGIGTRIACSEELRQRIRRVVVNEPYCLKDPRFCYTLSVWRPFLRNESFLCVFRDPAATSASILKECQHAPITLTFDRVFRIWTQMYEHVLKVHSREGRWLFMHYNQVLNGDGLDRLENFLEAVVDRAFPDISLKRSFSSRPVPQRTWRVYLELCERASYTWNERS
jgi:hypothetical protein